MKKLHILFVIVSLFFACEKLPIPDSNLASGNPHYQVAFLDSKSVDDIRVKDEEGSLKDTEIKVRIANPMDKDTYYRVSIDEALLAKFNQENGVDYQNLPKENFEMSYTDINKVTKVGSSFEVLIPKGKIVSAGKLSIKIKSMKNAQGVILPVFNVYALSVKMEPKDSKTIAQADKKNSLFVIRRSFVTPVAHWSPSDAFHAIYGKDTGKQEAGKESLYDDIEINEWTLQYSFALTRLKDNWGLMYENPRHNTMSTLWNTVQSDGKFLLRYGAAATLNFNTAKGKNFKFEAAGTNPIAEKWYHVAMTYKTIDGRPFLKMYINGELMFDSPSPLIVKKFPLVCFGNGVTEGYVRELRFWSKALTQGQVIASQYSVKTDTDGLELYVPFNEIPYEEVEEDGKMVRIIKNASTNPNKKYPEKWYINHNGSKYRFPNIDFNTKVEF
ncbi:DUF1735 and LamG domain-containing protein [Capnocytophaga canimorsus]|uniref:DUF1735 and LamG domain-containing protein n=1 Tax=Capnocytophaga canimorsus TaxID=28188 RepID=UPI0037D53C24